MTTSVRSKVESVVRRSVVVRVVVLAVLVFSSWSAIIPPQAALAASLAATPVYAIGPGGSLVHDCPIGAAAIVSGNGSVWLTVYCQWNDRFGRVYTGYYAQYRPTDYTPLYATGQNWLGDLTVYNP